MHALTDSSLEDRRRITFGALGAVVSRLTRIAWRATGFHDAVTALALLAEAENETWGNGASTAFLDKYQVSLSATALSYLQRLDTLDELAAVARPALVSLVVRALAGVENDPSGPAVLPPSDRAPEPDWSPSSVNEHLQCVEAAVSRLRTIAAQRHDGLGPALLDAATDVSWLLGDSAAVPVLTGFFNELREAYPKSRDLLRKQVAEVIRRNRERLSPKHLRTLERLHAQFEDASLGGRLRQHVGLQPWERDGEPDFSSLAAELLAPPEALAREWSWLTSGEAAGAWELGTALAGADPHAELAEELPGFPGSGRDLRVVCGYVAAHRKTLGDGWYERWVLTQFGREPQPLGLLLEVAWRCGVTERVATQVAELLHATRLSPALVGQLKYGDWTHVSADALQSLLRAMIDTGHGKTAISMLHGRMEHSDAETEHWQPMAMELVKDPDLIRSREMPNHYWQKVAELTVADCPRDIAAAIFRAHAQREERPEGWRLRRERAVVDVLLGCVNRDPAGVWQELIPYLSPAREAMWFVSGFPAGVIERVPTDDVLAWIAVAPRPQERPEGWRLRRERAVVDVLLGCVNRDPAGVWQELIPYLSPAREAMWFVSGFPAGVIERVPTDDVLAWIAVAPRPHAAQRAALLARLTPRRALADESLAGRIIAGYGRHRTVAQAFFSHHVSGVGYGPASRGWQDMAQELDQIAAHTNLSRLGRWAHQSAETLREMAVREREYEEEEELLVRSGA
jgi:hypothetical protein